MTCGAAAASAASEPANLLDDFPDLTAAELLQRVRKVIYGADWQPCLARELGLGAEAMSRIRQAADEGLDYDVADGMPEDLRALIEERIAERRRLEPLTHGS